MLVLLWITLSPSFPGAVNAKEVVHDAEFYVLEAQHGDKWKAQDERLRAKLDELERKHGTPPNIIHIMWDDTPVGDIGIPHLQKNRGFETPNMNQLGDDGIYFTRMVPIPTAASSKSPVWSGSHRETSPRSRTSGMTTSTTRASGARSCCRTSSRWRRLSVACSPGALRALG
jgi:arylsulfatase